jgi:hypothetical protein
MALGTLTLVNRKKSDGPVFFDRFTIVGDSAHVTDGTTGLQAKLRAACGDSRTIKTCKGFGSTAGYSCTYDAATDKLRVDFEDQTSGVVADKGSANVSAITFTCDAVSF